MDRLRVCHYLNSMGESFQIEEKSETSNSFLAKRNLQNSNSNLSKTGNTPTTTPERKNVSVLYNPFIVEPSSFSMPSFSPSVFTSQENNDENKLFSWNIEQIATLNPAEIDESSICHTFDKLDENKEEEVQKAIESYFLQNSVAPSPWGGSIKHVTFSPHLPTTNFFNEANSSTDSNTSIPVSKKDVWTQTTLAIPLDVNLEEILSKYMTFKEDQQVQNIELSVECATLEEQDILSTSSLRRKLFSPNRVSGSSEISSKTPRKSSTVQSQSADEREQPLLPSGQVFSSSPISLRAFSVSPCNSIPPLNESLISPIRRRSSMCSIADKKNDNAKFGEPIAYLKSILKSSPSCNKECVLKEDIFENESINMQSANSSQMTVSMATECFNSFIEKDNQENKEEIIDQSFMPRLREQFIEINFEGNKFAQYHNDGLKISNSDEKRTSSSQDTGYQTGSNPSISGIDMSVFGINNSKRDVFGATESFNGNCSSYFPPDNLNLCVKPRRKPILIDSAMLESNSAMEVAGHPRLYSVSEENQSETFAQDSIMHISTSNWKPTTCSTPQKED